MHSRVSLPNSSRDEQAQAKRVQTAITLLIFVHLIGTLGFYLIEDWPIWRCLYFTVITITTVGYGDEGISDAGAQFATFLLIFGLSAVSYAFSVLVHHATNREMSWRKQMTREIANCKDHVIVVGFGRMGRSLCEELVNEDYPFVVIDTDLERVEEAIELGFKAIQGSASDDDCLKKARIEYASHLAAMVGDEAQNIVAALTARELSENVEIISRAETSADERKLMRAGANQVVSPFHSGSLAISKMIAHPKVAEILPFGGPGHANIAFAEVRVENGSSLIGESLKDFGRDIVPHVCFVALERAGEAPSVPPRGEDTFCAGDIVIVAGDPGEVDLMKDSGRLQAQPVA